MRTVTVPAEFFRSELRVYPQWQEAFCRELLQNSIDAGATRIDVKFTTGPEGQTRVTFADDGSGMDRDTLENVFFALGRTTKTGGDTIGGFGRARIITCFAQHQYTISTGPLVVHGRGGTYTISDDQAPAQGCTFVIDMFDTSVAKARGHLTALVEQSALHVPVYVDGTRVSTGTLPARATRVLRDDDGRVWSKVYSTPDLSGQLRVQVRGLTMFTRWLSGTDDVVVDMVPERAREVLAASRGQLHSPYSEQLDQFIADLNINRRAALRPANSPLRVRVEGGGFLTTPVPSAGHEPAAAGAATSNGSQETATTTLTARRNPTHPGEQVVTSAGQEDRAGPATLGFDVFLMADTSDRATRARARRWNPGSWGTGASRRRRLVLTWKAAVGYAVDHLVTLQPHIGEVAWTVGLVFDQGTQARQVATNRGQVLALNPVDAQGRLRYRTSSAQDRRKLLALAVHEVCHVAVPHHDEAFASLLTTMFADLDPVAADRAMRHPSGG